MKLHVHAFNLVRDTGVHHYSRCRCGKRKVNRTNGHGYEPVDQQWLATGVWTERPTRAPRKCAA